MILMLYSKSLWATTFYRYRPRWTESWVSSLHQAGWKGGRLWDDTHFHGTDRVMDDGSPAGRDVEGDVHASQGRQDV